MGLFDFLKSRGGSSPASVAHQPLNDLVFKSGKNAIEYVRAFMRTEWKPNSLVVGLIGHPTLEGGVLSAGVLIPDGEDFVEIPTHTRIRAVSSPGGGRQLLGDSSNLQLLGLKSGDLVSVLLASRDDELLKVYPQTGGWVALVVAKNTLSYSLRDGGWRLERKYEL